VGKTTKKMSDEEVRKATKRVTKKKPAKAAVTKKAAKKRTTTKKSTPKTSTRKATTKKAAAKKATKKKVAKKRATRTMAAAPRALEIEAPPEVGEVEAPPVQPEAEARPIPRLHGELSNAVDVAERRIDRRHEVPGDLEVEVELFGYQREGREFGIGPKPDPSKKFQTVGVTVNLSLGGMLARVQEDIEDGSHCLVRFVNAGDCVRPDLRWGLVIRTVREDGTCEVAVKFDVPLEFLDPDGPAA